MTLAWRRGPGAAATVLTVTDSRADSESRVRAEPGVSGSAASTAALAAAPAGASQIMLYLS